MTYGRLFKWCLWGLAVDLAIGMLLWTLIGKVIL